MVRKKYIAPNIEVQIIDIQNTLYTCSNCGHENHTHHHNHHHRQDNIPDDDFNVDGGDWF